MKKISSGSTAFYKRGFPLLWFGFLAAFVFMILTSGAVGKDPLLLAMPCFMVIVGWVVMKRFIWDLADEVQDGGDFLLVRYKGREERIDLANIMNVSVSTNVNPPRITLRLVNPASFGRELVFSPVSGFTLDPLARNTIADDLIERVDRARVRRVAQQR
jgi:hypothetical protein